MGPIFSKTSTHVLGRPYFVALIILLCWAGVNAQSSPPATSPTDGSTPLGLSPGAPAGAYPLSGFESVNLFNGNLNFHLPLMGVGGRGGAGMTSMLAIDTKSWTVAHTEVVNPDTGMPIDVYTPKQGPWVPKPGYGPGILVGRHSGENPNQQCPAPGGGVTRYIYQQTLTRLTFTASDGTEYEFRDQLTGGQPAPVPTGCSPGASRGTVFFTADGTSATFISDTVIFDKPQSKGANTIQPSGFLMLRDGTRYRIESGAVTWMRDRNGNKLTFNGGTGGVGPGSGNFGPFTITDSLNRQVTVTFADFVNTFADQISYKGFGGGTRSILISRTALSNALRPGYSIQSYHGLFPELNNASSNTNFNPQVVSGVTLPNGQQYQFQYNSYAELARVVLPTGGAFEYDYTPTSGAISDGTDYHIYRRVVERRVYPDGGTGSGFEQRTTYSDATNGYVTVDRWNSAGTRLERERHYFHGDAVSSLFMSSGISYPAWNHGREYKTELIDANGTNVLRTINNTWQQGVILSGWAPDIANNPRISETTTIVEPAGANLVSKQTFGYDDAVPYNNQNNVKEYDFGAGGAGPLLRETRTTFVNDPGYTGTGVHIRGLAAQSSIYDSGGIQQASSAIEYDNYGTDANHAALVFRSNISGLDSSFTTAYTTRGNPTATTHYLLSSSGAVTGSITGYAQYDIAGNVVKTIDARGNAHDFDFTDRYGWPNGEARLNSGAVELGAQMSYAIATRTTNALGHTAYTQFDYYIGRPVDGEDANGLTSGGFYSDALDRPTEIVRAANNGPNLSQTTFAYNDAGRTVTITSDQNSYTDNVIKRQTVHDGLGRTIESRQFETPSDYITVRTNYDALGRPFQESNPFRLGEAILWTSTGHDALGRVVSITTPDTAVVTNTYSANSVTISDQMGKQRRNVTDALGRLIQVFEAPNDPAYNHLTTYNYDALDNLRTVSQGGQTRLFAFDSIKRLTSSTSPESGTTNYVYDNNGNLLVKSDARGVSTHVSYDAQNRPIRRWYNGSDQVSATINNSPALPGGVGASSEVNFFYDSQGLPGGAPPNFQRGSSIGRLVAVTYGSGSSAGDYYGYDAVGRTVIKVQQIGGINYQTTAVYNRASEVISETYPSGHTVSYAYDQAGRTGGFSGNLGDGVSRSYSSGIIYSPMGGMAKEQFGTDTPIFNKLFYNSRGQLGEIRESTSYTGPNDTTWNRGAIINHYSNAPGAWGATGGGPDNNGNLKKQEVYIPLNDQLQNAPYTTWWQRYDYDSLNRLQRVFETTGNPQADWQQEYVYDRYGNRTIHQTNTWGMGINKINFAVNAVNNRLGVPGGQPGVMSYDLVGNLTTDTYTGAGSRTYDAEGRMTSAQGGINASLQHYTYDAAGQRVRRTVNGVETWQVYGIAGKLIAEYASNAGPTVVKKEYGYRNGQLLIAAEPASGQQLTPQNVIWTSVSPTVQVTGNSIQKMSGAYAWDAGAVSSQTLASGDGYVDFIPGETGTFRMCGLGNNNTSTYYADIEYAFFIYGGGGLQIYEAGIDRGSFGSYAASDHLKIAVENGVVKYYRNSTLLYTSTVPPQYPLQVDTSLNTVYAGVYNVVIASTSQATSGTTQWLVSDQLGTPRITFDKTGSFANVKRHDYLPFGEELFAGQGLRTTTLGYVPDGVRQGFTGYEKDTETGLNYAQARYQSSAMGRFTSPDSTLLSVNAFNPQSWNRYAYVDNNPLLYADPLGLWKIYYVDIEKDVKQKDGTTKKVFDRKEVFVKKSKPGDDGATLAKQLGLKGKDAEKFAAKIGNGDNIRLADQDGKVGTVFKAVEKGLSDQGRWEQKNSDKLDALNKKGQSGPWHSDCSKTACQVGLGQYLGPRVGTNVLDPLLDTAATAVAESDASVGDIIRYAKQDNIATHFANFIFRDDDKAPWAFSKSGTTGPYHVVTASSLQLPNYGTIRGRNSGDSGYYRKN